MPTPMPAREVRIQADDFDLGAEVQALHADADAVGAVASFVGTVRRGAGGEAIDALTLEHYPGMTERAIEAMVAQARRRFRIEGVRVVHRVGRLLPGERIVLVAVASSHRAEAFQACEFLMDYLKTQAPFWKQEAGAAGTHWVDARVADDAALARWGLALPANAAAADAESGGGPTR